jgi:GntR family transcriptional regulator/MocR family aminotransferase
MDLAINIDRDSSDSLQEQLVQQLRQLIERGLLANGHPLPSTRALAEQLGVARVTVTEAYNKLKAQGFIEYKRNARATVSTAISAQTTHRFIAPATNIDAHLNAFGRRVSGMELIRSTSADLPELGYGGVDLTNLPSRQWQSLIRQTCERIDWAAENRLVEDLGYRPLRNAIAEYVGRTRGIGCSAENVLVFGGSQQSLSQICSLLLGPGDLVLMENPGFIGARQAFSAHGASIQPLAVDQQGAIPPDITQAAKLAYVSSLHQDPTGAVMSMERRQQFCRWAAKHRALIIEDDFDFHFRASGKALSALAAVDALQRVIYYSTFWKTLFPLCQVGFLIVPDPLVDAFHRSKLLAERSFSLLENVVLTKFLNTGAFEQYVEKSRKAVVERRRTAIAALTKSFGSRIVFNKQSGGTQLCMRLPDHPPERIELAAISANLPVLSTRDHYLVAPVEGEFLLHFSNLAPGELEQRISNFVDALGRV